jgi:hypothetical protein
MPVETVLQLLDELVLNKTGEHLNHTQKTILKSSLEGKTYADIANESYLSEGHIGDMGSELWKILSDILGIDISKKTAKSILGNGDFYNNIGRDFVALNNVHICTDNTHSKPSTPQPEKKHAQPHLDLGTAPDISHFYGRTEELQTLEKWLIGDRCRLIAILGQNGIGKTALSRQLIEQIQTHFDYVIYRSLYWSPTLDKLLTQLLQIFPQSTTIPDDTEDKISLLLNHFRQYRCLLILDDLHQLFKPEQLSGHYKTGYESYHLFFNLIGKQYHQSVLILNSQEKLQEIGLLEKKNTSIRSLTLSSLGSAAKEILKDHKLLDEENWDTLIDNYQGNAGWLEITAVMIQDLFRGSVDEFLAYSPLTLADSLKDKLDRQFQRLAELEKKVITLIVKESSPISLRHLSNNLSVSPSELLNIIDSLKRRILLELKQQNQETILLVNPVLKAMISINEVQQLVRH